MSGVFDKLPSPAKRNEIALRKELEHRRDIWPHPTYYKGGGDLLLRHGKFFGGRILPEDQRHLMGEECECFNNALRVALDDPTLTYCEGVYSSGSGHFTAHAWLLDPQGLLLEVTLPTWEITNYHHHLGPNPSEGAVKYLDPSKWGYWGVTFNAQFTRIVREATDGHPLLDRSPSDQKYDGMCGLDLSEDRISWPALEKPWSMQRTEP